MKNSILFASLFAVALWASPNQAEILTKHIKQDSSFSPYESLLAPSQPEVQIIRPPRMNSIIADLPEYNLNGPGYVCEIRQAPAVYRQPLQYYRGVGYREADWTARTIYDMRSNPVNTGGYNY